MIKKLYNKFKERKANNSGFTLVELIVAITILALVVVPTMQVFVTATKTNTKARTKLQATITANSVLESAKGFSIYAYSQQCHLPSRSKFTLIASLGSKASFGELKVTTTGDGFKVNGSGYTDSEGANHDTKFVISSLGDASKEPSVMTESRQRANYYAFYINGIKQTNKTYDAVVVFEKKADDTKVNIGGKDITASQFGSTFNNYLSEYTIHVFVYKHEDTPAYLGEKGALLQRAGASGKFKASDNCLEYLTGSKLDSAIIKK